VKLLLARDSDLLILGFPVFEDNPPDGCAVAPFVKGELRSSRKRCHFFHNRGQRNIKSQLSFPLSRE
jgi:hypothetical protein